MNEKYRVTITHDANAESPREDECNLGFLACSHNNYNMSDDGVSIEDAPSQDDDDYVMLPVYMYEHGGCTISTSPFSCPWDSGQIGWIWCSFENAKEHLQNPDVTYDDIAEQLKSEIKIYDTFIRGDVFGFILEEAIYCEHSKRTEWDVIESCWGFLGYNHIDNGMVEHLPEEVRPVIQDIEVDSPMLIGC
jgi:hypothetical protein